MAFQCFEIEPIGRMTWDDTLTAEDSDQENSDQSKEPTGPASESLNAEAADESSETAASFLWEEHVTPTEPDLEELEEAPATSVTPDDETSQDDGAANSQIESLAPTVAEPDTAIPTGFAQRNRKIGLGIAIGIATGIALTIATHTALQPSKITSFVDCLEQFEPQTTPGTSAPQVVVAPFFNDPSGTQVEHFVGALQSFERKSNIKLLYVRAAPCFIPADGTSVLEGKAQAQKAAEQLSRITGAKAVIWGEAFADDNRLKLFATYANGLDDTLYSNDQFTIPMTPSDEFGELVAAKIWLSDQSSVVGNSPRSGNELQAVITALDTHSDQMQNWSSYQKGQLHHVLAQARFQLGTLNNEVPSMEKAIEDFATAGEFFGRLNFSEQWAQIQNDLGAALFAFGKAQNSLPEIDMAISSFQAALSQNNRVRSPLKWAAAKANLADALSVWGPREPNDEKLRDAVEAYRSALEVHTLERTPLEWASLQHRLAATLYAIGQKRKDTNTIQQAVDAYRLALEIRTPEISRTGFVDSQISLAAALSSLAVLGAGDATIGDAIDAFRAALSQIDRDADPTRWATLHHSLGIGLLARAEVNPDIELLLQAHTAFLTSLQVFSREEVPARWAVAQNNLGNALKELGTRENSAELMQAAIEAYEKALEVFADTSPAYAQSVVQNLSRSQQLHQTMLKGQN